METPERTDFGIPEAGAHDHVACAVEDRLDKVRDTSGRIGRVSIEHDIDVGIDLLEHRPDDVALTLPADADNAHALLSGDLGRPVGAVVVEDNDRGVGAARPYFVDYRGDSR